MSVYQKLKLLFKASAEAPLKQLVEQNDILIFQQEIEQAESAVKRAKLHLAGTKTEIKLLNTNTEELTASINKRENQVLQILDKDEKLAEELADIIATEEAELSQLQAQLKKLRATENRVMSELKSAIRKIQRHRQQLGILRANQHSLHARQMTQGSAQGLNSSVTELNSTLENIQQRQQRTEFHDESVQEVDSDLGESGINARLQKSGVETDEFNRKAVLDRLRARKTESDAA